MAERIMRRRLVAGAAVAVGGVLAVGSAQAAPVNEVRPAVKGSLVHGTVATCAPGRWAGAQRFEYQWYRGVARADTPIEGQTRPRLLLDRPRHAPVLACVVTAIDADGARSRAGSAERPTRVGRTIVRVTRAVPLRGVVRVPNSPLALRRVRVSGFVGPAPFLTWSREVSQSRNPRLGSLFITRGRVSALPRGSSRVDVRNPRGRFAAIVHLPPGRSVIRVTFAGNSDWRSSQVLRRVVVPR